MRAAAVGPDVAVALQALESDARRWTDAAVTLRGAADAVAAQALDPGVFSFAGADVATPAAEFFREALATFELAVRASIEAHETARLQSEHAQRQRRLAAASLAINGELSPEAILRVAAREARSLLGASAVHAEIRLERETGLPGGLGARDLRIVRASDPPGTPDPGGRTRVTVPLGVRRTAAAPLGSLTAVAPTLPEGEREPIAEQLGLMASVALENAQRYARERRIAQTLQRSLLPPSLPTIPGIDVAARFSPAGDGIQVGGDFYDVFRAGERDWGMVIGDVCGKGPEAAALTALARYTLRATAMTEQVPSRILATLNEAMLRAEWERVVTDEGFMTDEQ